MKIQSIWRCDSLWCDGLADDDAPGSDDDSSSDEDEDGNGEDDSDVDVVGGPGNGVAPADREIQVRTTGLNASSVNDQIK